MSELDDVVSAVGERLALLPPDAFECDACSGSMAFLHSRLYTGPPPRDEIRLQCLSCWAVRMHNLPITDDERGRELAWRNRLDGVDGSGRLFYPVRHADDEYDGWEEHLPEIEVID